MKSGEGPNLPHPAFGHPLPPFPFALRACTLKRFGAQAGEGAPKGRLRELPRSATRRSFGDPDYCWFTTVGCSVGRIIIRPTLKLALSLNQSESGSYPSVANMNETGGYFREMKGGASRARATGVAG